MHDTVWHSVASRFSRRWHFTKICRCVYRKVQKEVAEISTWRVLLAEGTNVTFERKKKVEL